MIKYFLLYIAFLSFMACQDVQRPEKPDDLIGKDKMVDIFTDSYLSNAARSIDNRSIRGKGIRLDSFIYNKYDIDSVQFAKSNAYYTANLNEYNKLFERVKERLTNLQKQTDSIKNLVEKQSFQPKDTVKKQPQLIPPSQSDSL